MCFRLFMNPLILLAGTLLLIPVIGQGADDLDANRERLNRIQGRIQETQHSLTKKNVEARSLRDELHAVEGELRHLERRQRQLKQRLSELDSKGKQAESEASVIRREVDAQRLLLEKRVAALYKGGGGGVLKLLFSGLGPSDLDTQFRYTLRVVEHDRKLLDDYLARKEALEQKRREIEQLKAKHVKGLEELRTHRQVLAEAGRLKRDILARVRKDQRLLASLKKELEEKASRLSSLVSKLELDPGVRGHDTSPFAKQRGRLPWPVTGKVKVGFGTQRHPDLGSLFESNGIEIATDGEVAIKALWKGKVAFASPFKGYGNLVIIDHGDGYHTLYAHAARISTKVGARVDQGDVVAYSGDPGASGVYFEIRRQGKPVDPEAWLARR